jgi:hypothetical protein
VDHNFHQRREYDRTMDDVSDDERPQSIASESEGGGDGRRRTSAIGRNRSSSSKFRYWVFTLNNYTDAERASIEAYVAPECVYLCYQPERGSNGTPHLQGAFCLKSKSGRTRVGLKARLFRTDRIFLDPKSRYSSIDEFFDYCSKAESRDGSASFGFTDFGDRSQVPKDGGQGTRNDIHVFSECLKAGKSISSLAKDYPEPFVRYHKGFFALQSLLFEPRMGVTGRVFNAPRVFWFHGPTGSGKTRAAVEDSTGEIYWKMPDNKWWDGYTQQPVVILDDFRGSWFSVSYLLRLLDGYDYTVEAKGCSLPFNSKTIYITCPHPPEIVFANLKESDEGKFQQITRRITEIRQFGEPIEVTPYASIFNNN